MRTEANANERHVRYARKDRPDRRHDVSATGRPFVALVVMEATTTAKAAGAGEPPRPAHPPLYQENFVLVHAGDEPAARERVARRARAAETSYLNEQGETVTWRLKAIVDVKEAEDPDLGSDADLYTRHFRDWDAYERMETLLSGEPA